MTQPFEISLNSRAVCGAGAAERLPERLQALGLRRVALIVDEAVLQQPPLRSLLRAWEASGVAPIEVFAARSGVEPDYEYLDAAAERVRPAAPDVILGVGGGSAMDLAKGVGVLLRNPGQGISYRGMDLVQVPGVPVVLLPTLAGCGSEVTATASFIDRASNTKLGINGRYVGCAFAVLDPTLLVTCPPSVTLGSALDALVHAIEAVTATTANPMSRAFAGEAVRLVFEALPTALSDPADLPSREQLLLASFHAGVAMTHAAGGPASGVSYPLGVHWHVPHGYAGGLLLPHVIAANIAKGYAEGYAYLHDRVLPAAGAPATEAVRAGRFRDALFDLYRRCGAPETFARWGVDRGAVDRLTELTMTQRQGNLKLNPVAFGRDDVTALVMAVLPAVGEGQRRATTDARV